MKQLAIKIRQFLKIHKSFLADIIYYYKLIIKYNASINTDNDVEKMQYTLLRENHTIEKGLSLRNPRKGFGQQKILNLLDRLNLYLCKYGEKDKNFLYYPLGTIKHYISYTKSNGVEIPAIEEKYKSLVDKSGLIDIKEQGGIVQITQNDILKQCNTNFKSLLMSRHSIRYFSKEDVAKDAIDQALKLAQRTPSACNRQGWHTHVFQGEKSINLIKWQGGCHGFEDEIRTSILVTANLKAFLYYEIHQSYAACRCTEQRNRHPGIGKNRQSQGDVWRVQRARNRGSRVRADRGNPGSESGGRVYCIRACCAGDQAD